jgi:hypothetical protein
VGEAALLLLAATPCANREGIGERVERVAASLLPHARSERVQARVCLEPSIALEHALAHACLSRIGHPDAGFDAMLAASLASEGACGCERMPHRQLEQEWMLRVWSPAGAPAAEQRGLVRRTALALPADLLTVRKDALYALTHAAMYASDLGETRVRLPRAASVIAGEVAAALAACLDEPDYDLGAELLLMSPHLRLPWSAVTAFAFDVLARVHDAFGFLPSPGITLQRLEGLSGSERERFVATRSYHTIFVMGLLSAALIRSPPRVTKAAGRHAGASAEILALIGPIEPAPAWLAYSLALDPGPRDAASPLFLDICLRRAVLQRNFTRLREALLIAQRFDLLDGPFPWQAAQLLARASAAYGQRASVAA